MLLRAHTLLLAWVLLYGITAVLCEEQNEASSGSPAVLSELDAKLTNRLSNLLGFGSTDSLNLNDELGLEDDEKKHKQELAQTQQKAYLDGYMNAYNQIRFAQIARRETLRRRRRHRRHHHKMAASTEESTAMTDGTAVDGGSNTATDTTATTATDNNVNTNDKNNENNQQHDDASKERFRATRRRRRRRRHRHTLTSYPGSASTYFQQYYAHPRFSAYYPYWNTFHRHHHHHRHRHHHDTERQKKAQQAKLKAAAQMRFREQLKAKAEAEKRSIWSYGDSFNSIHPVDVTPQRISDANTPVGGYSPPMAVNEPVARMPTAVARAPAIFGPLRSNNFPAQMRFMSVSGATDQSVGNPGTIAAAGASVASMANDVNPNGVPMPFYPPTAPPPPAPNQVPVSAAIVNGVYPDQSDTPTAASMPPVGAGMTQSPGVDGAAQPMGPNQPPAQVNNYPFSSFVEVASSSKQ